MLAVPARRAASQLARSFCTTPKYMRGVVVEGEGAGAKAVVQEGLPVPVPEADEVLIKVSASGINRPDLLQKAGLYPAPPGSSPLLGLEVAGHLASGEDAGTPVMALTNGGGYAEYCVVPRGQVMPLETSWEMPMHVAAAIPEALLTAWYNVLYLGGLRPGGAILIHGGTSGVGSAATRLAAAQGARCIITTVGSQAKAELSKELGAHHTVVYREQPDWDKAIKADADVWQRVTGKHVDAQHSTSSAGHNLQRSCGHGVKEAVADGLGPSGAGAFTPLSSEAAHDLPALPCDGLDCVLDMVGGGYIPKSIGLLGTGGRHVSIAFQQGSKVPSMDFMRVMLKRLQLTGSTLRSRSPAFKASLVADVMAAISAHRLFHAPPGVRQVEAWGLYSGSQGCRHLQAAPLAPLLAQRWPMEQVEEAHVALKGGDMPGKHVLEW